MDVETTAIDGPLVLRPKRFGDARGFFSEVFNRTALEAVGIREDWSQDNHAWSAARGVVRGLHFQTPPFAQAKLVRVSRGAVLDVVVDIRRASPTYGQHVGVELSAEAWTQLYVPAGFAHGYCTLTEDCEVLYKVTGKYAPEAEGGLRWNDPDLRIAWPVAEAEATVNARDQAWPGFASFKTVF
jgi:dTDP-4-dehydrorhamnose 3,5-epimerase